MLAVSFCHGYQDKSLMLDGQSIPSLLLVDQKNLKLINTISFPFPRTQNEFSEQFLKLPIVGIPPLNETELDTTKLPRFGLMGLAKDETYLYAASWNGIYRLRLDNYEIHSFITNQLINDPHGIFVRDGLLYSVATSLDSVVITDISSGNIVDYFSVGRDLTISKNPDLLGVDWRFISKQSRGAVGNWHFNHVTIVDDYLYLTSRLTSSMVEINLNTMESSLRTICWDTPVMLHDGIPDGIGGFVFTSVDGKILPAGPASTHQSSLTSLESNYFTKHMNRDMVNSSIRLPYILDREVNWCRGIAFDDLYYYTALEGRYDQSRPFFRVAQVLKAYPHTTLELEISYSMLTFPSKLRYMTGFSLMVL